MMQKRSFFLVAALFLFLAACRHNVVPTLSSPAGPATATATLAPTLTATNTVVPSPTAEDTRAASGSLIVAEALAPGPTPTWPPPVATPALLAPATITAEMLTTWTELEQAEPPERDDVRLALAYRGLTQAPELDAPLATTPLAVGERQHFTIANVDNNTLSTIEAELLAVGEHAYFWFDLGPGSFQPGSVELNEAAAAFDRIYQSVIYFFGPEDNPGIDGDPRLHIIHASPLSLCDVTLESVARCGLAGYFNASNVLPVAVDASSNEREMFVMNVRQFGASFYLNVLGHEFRHMVEDNHHRGDVDWEVEGSAVLAEELLGYPASAQHRANLFLQNPDQQLNSWTNSNTLPHYGQGYLLNRYIFERLGVDLYRQFATSPDTGLRAIDSVAAANGLDLTGESLWLDWLVALAIHSEPLAPARYRLGEIPLNTAAMTNVSGWPAVYDTTVAQYAADYYQLPAEPVTIYFSGSQLARLLDAPAPSGQMMWYAQRANYRNPRLTRTVDLRGVDAATLYYAAYVDIEKGYDFAYVSVSQDGGQTWQGVAAKHMQGLSHEDDPSGTALAERFYTGRQQQWLQESVDLSAYAGQVIQLRFEYITDLILTYGGFALDNIAIPEIGFYDDAETIDPDWIAEGFTRATAYLPQRWHLQLITFEGEIPTVTALSLPAEGRLTLAVDGRRDENRPVLIVAATAPMTLERATYKLEVSE